MLRLLVVAFYCALLGLLPGCQAKTASQSTPALGATIDAPEHIPSTIELAGPGAALEMTMQQVQQAAERARDENNSDHP